VLNSTEVISVQK